MCTRQKYAQGNLCPNPSEPTVGSTDFDPAKPWLIPFKINAQQIDTGQWFIIPSDLELIIVSLNERKNWLANRDELASTLTEIETIDDLLAQLEALTYKALSVRVDYIANLAGK